MRFQHITLPWKIASLFHKREVNQEDLDARLSAIGTEIGKIRDKAVEYRRQSGLEEVMLKAEEAYLGIDDANRGTFSKAAWAKPPTMEGSLTKDVSPSTEIRSTVFFPLTARYVDAASAKVSEILIPTDDKPFSLKPTPVPDEVKILDDQRQLVHNGQPQRRDATPEEAAALQGQAPPEANPVNPAFTPKPVLPQQPGTGPAMPLTPADLAEEKAERMDKKTEAAEKQIYDWLVECNYANEMRRSLKDAARIGVSVMKGPFPKVKRAMALTKNADGSYTVEYKQKIVPAFERKNPWNIYPDPNCGESIRKGAHCFEVDRFSRLQLLDLKKEKDYLPGQIDKVLEEGPSKKYAETRDPSARPDDDERFEVWFMYGTLEKKDMATILSALPEDPTRRPLPEKDTVAVIVTMVNDTVIKACLNPLDSGAIPYNNFPWKVREGYWIGVGIGEQGDVPQRMCNGALRAMMDNAGLASGVNMVIDRNAIEPAKEGGYVIGKNSVFYTKFGNATDDVRKAFWTFSVPSLQKECDAILERSFVLMEHATNIPLISQGQSGDTTPDTLGQTEIQNNNANQLLRDVGYRYDDCQTEPAINDLYEWMLVDDAVPNDCKGDFQVLAKGSVALVERAIQDQTIASMLTVAPDPRWGLNPRLVIKNWMKSKKLAPADYVYTKAEQDKIDSQPPPKPYQVQVAEMRAQVDQERIKSEKDRDTIYVQAETDRTIAEGKARMAELEIKRQIAQAEHELEMEALKVKLAEVTMKLNVQKELAAKDRAAEVLAPPTEPAGRAKPGHSFQQ